MNNKELLERASKLQKEFAELYKDSGFVGISGACASKLQKKYVDLYLDRGFVGISTIYIQVTIKKFHALEKEGLLEHISKTLAEKMNRWDHEAMTPQGVKITTFEYDGGMVRGGK